MSVGVGAVNILKIDPSIKSRAGIKSGGARGPTNRHARAPKQERSRRSFERMINAATAILDKGGLAALTLTEVSHRSGVSIGSIYGRLDGKEQLVRAVQAQALSRMEQEFAAMVGELRRQKFALRELVPSVVHELARFLQRHARLLSAFMQAAMTDPVVASVGRQAHFKDLSNLRLLLLERRSEILHPDPEHASATCFTVVYGALARYLGLGPSSDSVGEGNWDRLLDDLGLMALAFLLMDLPPGTPAAKRRR
jgi:AcrR family transcriptional regulator